MERVPYLLLPKTVEVLYDCLDSAFMRGGKDQCDSPVEADPRNGTNHVRMVVSALEARVVVRLRKTRQAMHTPVLP